MTGLIRLEIAFQAYRTERFDERFLPLIVGAIVIEMIALRPESTYGANLTDTTRHTRRTLAVPNIGGGASPPPLSNLLPPPSTTACPK